MFALSQRWLKGIELLMMGDGEGRRRFGETLVVYTLGDDRGAKCQGYVRMSSDSDSKTILI